MLYPYMIILNNRSENQSPINFCFSFFVSFPALASLCASQLMSFFLVEECQAVPRFPAALAVSCAGSTIATYSKAGT
jgi:hypothetical protein